MKYLVRSKTLYLMILLDVVLLGLSLAVSELLRFEFKVTSDQLSRFLAILPVVLLIKIAIFYLSGLYRGMWRYTSMTDVLNILKATIASSLAVVAAIVFIFRFENYSRAVFIIDGLLTFLFISGSRAAIRIFFKKSGPVNLASIKKFLFENGRRRQGKKLLIIGAGNAGEKMLREIIDNPRLNYLPVGFLDDDPEKRSHNIHGVSVLGPVDNVVPLARKKAADEVLIAVPSASARELHRIIDLCDKSGLKYRTTPGIGELIDGEVSIKMVREVSYEDLLGREQVVLDAESIAAYIKGKKVLVTGAAGSIGSELCRQMARYKPARIIMADKTENSLFNLEMEFGQRFPDVPHMMVLGDIQNRTLLYKFFEKNRPEVVFHAAAFKHVHIVENNPWHGVLNNIWGTLNVAAAAYEFGVNAFVMVSTDKAVRPVGVMGATKRVAEMITSCYGRLAVQDNSGRRFSSVRFGNVLGSEGSVFQLFKKQIERLGPVTITHPDITRYFMTIPEAARLILQAGALGKGGEVFILDMGTPIKIVDMARELIKRSGYEPDRDIEIKFVGLRPGEKLHEELIAEGEEVIKTTHEKIVVLKQNECDLPSLKAAISMLLRAAEDRDAAGIKLCLQEIVPEYHPLKGTALTK